MPAPLEGIRVVDFTRYQNGPHATAMLADMGADVLKVEMPGNGDPGRQLGVGADGFCSYFEALNRGKRSMTLDLRAVRICAPGGVETFDYTGPAAPEAGRFRRELERRRRRLAA